jgi:hypothetical protein
MPEKTYLEKVIDEVLRPINGALELMTKEITESMQIPDSPWKILNKTYDQLSEQEIMALFDIYHEEGETTPCPMCNWAARTELMKSRQDKKEGL